MTLAQRRSAASAPLLSVQDLVVRFRTHEGTIHAVNGVSFELEHGETPRPRRRVRLRQERHEPRPHAAPAQAGRPDRGRAGHVRRPDLPTLPEDELRAIRGRDIAMIFQDPMTSLNPVLTIEEQMIETIQAHKQIDKAEARERAIELLAMVGIPQARDAPQELPAPVLRRHAPARDDRDGARARAAS